MSDPETHSVAIVRLSTGEELIGPVNAEANPDEVYIENPYIIVPTGDGKITAAMYMPYAKGVRGGLYIPRKFVMWVVTPHEQLTESYNEMNSNIVTPSKQIITDV